MSPVPLPLVTRALKSLARLLALLALVTFGTILLMRFAPGYFADARELDPRYAAQARTSLAHEQATHGTVTSITRDLLRNWSHADLGQSRQYDIPVAELLRPRLAVSASLLARALLLSWLIALAAALPISALRRHRTLATLPFTLLLAVPTGAMATICLLADYGSDHGGPVLVLTLILAARDFKFLLRTLSSAWLAPHLLHARALGLPPLRLLRTHILPNALPQILSLLTMSLVTAFSALVPVEVIFDVPGLGQLAWSAALNRDLPVLIAVTLLLATAVALAATLAGTVARPTPHPSDYLEAA